jgi:FkbM family methyltransferase
MFEIKLAFDIGFNEGIYTDHLIKNYPNIKVIGIEGHPDYASGKLKYVTPHNITRPNVTVIHGVISDRVQKEVPFYICDSNPGINTLNLDWKKTTRHKAFFEQTEKKILVRATTLDKLISIYGIPDLIKLDIEGAESLALKGLTQKAGIITFEWCEEYFKDTLKCLELLKKLGYQEFGYTITNEQNNLNPNVDGNLIDKFQPNIIYTDWNNFDLPSKITSGSSDLWGMIYAK